ncbi:MAG: pilin [Patescibacteria group bacterium]
MDAFPNSKMLCYGPKVKIGETIYKGTCALSGTAVMGADCYYKEDCAVGTCLKQPHKSADGLQWSGVCGEETGSYVAPIQTNTVSSLKFTPQIPIPNTEMSGTVDVGHPSGTKMVSDLFPKYIGAFYRYGLSIVGIIATVMLMAGGILWLTSAGNDGKVSKGKEMIFSSLAGIALLYGSYLILSTINPQLIQLKPLESPDITKVVIDVVCCDLPGKNSEMTTSIDCQKKGGARKSDYFIENNKCVSNGCCIKEELSEGSYKTIYCHPGVFSMCEQENGSTRVMWHKEKCSDDLLAMFCNGTTADGEDIHATINECEGKDDGETCTEGTCYSQICRTKNGKINEKCGNDGGICSVYVALPPLYYPSCVSGVHDNVLGGQSGSSCDIGLRCCTTK